MEWEESEANCSVLRLAGSDLWNFLLNRLSGRFIEFWAKSVCGKVSRYYLSISLWMAQSNLFDRTQTGSAPAAPTFDLWGLDKHL